MLPTNDPRVTEDAEVLALLESIDRGEVDVYPEPTTAGAPEIEFRTADGWHLRVANDCGDWDYLDAYRRPGSSEWVEALMSTDAPGLPPLTAGEWRPTHLARWHWTTSLTGY